MEVLLYGCLKSCCQLMELGQKKQQSRAALSNGLGLTRQWIHNCPLLPAQATTGSPARTMQVLRRRPTPEQYGDQQHQNEFKRFNPR